LKKRKKGRGPKSRGAVVQAGKWQTKRGKKEVSPGTDSVTKGEGKKLTRPKGGIEVVERERGNRKERKVKRGE